MFILATRLNRGPHVPLAGAQNMNVYPGYTGKQDPRVALSSVGAQKLMQEQ